MVLAGAVAAGCALGDGAKRFVGIDTASHPEVCLVVAPRNVPGGDVERHLDALVEQVAQDRGRLTAFLADGPSATAFPRLFLGSDAHDGDFASPAANEAARRREAHRRAAVARANLVSQVREAAARLEPEPSGLDLLGGIAECARQLRAAGIDARLVVISHGIHRTSDFNLVTQPERAPVELPLLLEASAVGRFDLELLALGRTLPNAAGEPAARALVEPVVDGWEAACAHLRSRCIQPRRPTSTQEES